jgi:hypothetical protein
MDPTLSRQFELIELVSVLVLTLPFVNNHPYRTNGHVQPVFDTLLAKCNGKVSVFSLSHLFTPPITSHGRTTADFILFG